MITLVVSLVLNYRIGRRKYVFSDAFRFLVM